MEMEIIKKRKYSITKICYLNNFHKAPPPRTGGFMTIMIVRSLSQQYAIYHEIIHLLQVHNY